MIDSALKTALASGVDALGLEFVGHEMMAQSGRNVLRVYIDTDDGGIGIDQITQASRHLSSVLDVAEAVTGRYTLEVSSPGINRPLFELEHYAVQLGKTVQLRLHVPLNDRRNFTGTLVRLEDQDVVFLCDDEELTVPFQTIQKAHIVGDTLRGNKR